MVTGDHLTFLLLLFHTPPPPPRLTNCTSDGPVTLFEPSSAFPPLYLFSFSPFVPLLYVTRSVSLVTRSCYAFSLARKMKSTLNTFLLLFSAVLLVSQTLAWREIHRDAMTIVFGLWKTFPDHKHSLDTVIIPNCETSKDEEAGHDVPPAKWPSKGKGKWV